MNPVPATIRRRDLAAIQARALRHRAPNAARREERRVDEHRGPTRVRLWLPVTPLFWLLSPFAVLFAPLIALAPPFRGTNPYAVVVGLGHVLTSLGGTKIHVDTPDAHVRITLL